MAERIDLQQDQGATFKKRFIWKTDTATPTPVNVTGYTGRMQIRPSIDSATVIKELTTTNGGVTVGGADGYVDLYMSDEETALIAAPATYRYDLELESPTGEVTRLVEGKLKFRPEVTRPVNP
jgi:hypothetical protein